MTSITERAGWQATLFFFALFIANLVFFQV